MVVSIPKKLMVYKGKTMENTIYKWDDLEVPPISGNTRMR
jgi:hypothetical protein